MTKHSFLFAFFLSILLSSNIFSQVPEQLVGLWEGKDRYILVGQDGQLAIVLKLYYGWYLDRIAEPETFSQQKKRPRNNATTGNGLRLNATFSKIENTDSAWEITLFDNKKEISTIPIAVKDKKLYLDFLHKTYFDEESKTEFWQEINSSQSIRITERKNQKNLYSWYICGKDVYKLRFWETDMEADPFAQAEFTDKDNVYKINKFITSAKKTYTCTTGKSSRIRNVEKFENMPSSFKIIDDICILSDEYLKKIDDSSSAQELIQILNEADKKIKPQPPSPFSQIDLDWHWDLINELEKDNKQIQELRRNKRID